LAETGNSLEDSGDRDRWKDVVKAVKVLNGLNKLERRRRYPLIYFHQNLGSRRISVSRHPVHEMSDFIMWMKHIYVSTMN